MTIDSLGRPTLDGFDPLSEEFLADPYPTLARARRETPVFFYAPMDFWVITREADLGTAVSDFRTFSSRAIGVVPPPTELADRVPRRLMDEAFINIDPPKHTVLRKQANQAFTRPRIAAMESDIGRIAHELIDGFADRGGGDLMREYFYLLPTEVVIKLLGLPREDIPRFRRWTEDYFNLLAPLDADDETATTTKPMSDADCHRHWTGLADAYEYLTAAIQERLERPREDLTSALVHATDEEGRKAVNVERIVIHIIEFIAAGNDTTANLMGQMAMFFDRSPEQLAAVKADPSLMGNAVEEGLRRRGTSPGLFRITTREVQLGGAAIPAGSLVWLLYMSAGHDESQFERPERFDIYRENANKHMSFGRGRHMCIGAPLARLEARIGLNTLYQRIPSLRIVPDQKLTYEPALTVLVLRSLLAEWDAQSDRREDAVVAPS
jgi:cytochrome P450